MVKTSSEINKCTFLNYLFVFTETFLKFKMADCNRVKSPCLGTYSLSFKILRVNLSLGRFDTKPINIK